MTEQEQSDPRRFTASTAHTTHMADILATGATLEENHENQSLSNLVSAMGHVLLESIKQNNTQITAHCLNDQEELGPEMKTTLDKTTNVLKEIDLLCYKQNQKS